jgi:phospho-N-acetylmuramoyl-pentapeptide-transferase
MKKSGTPTMGGLAFLIAISASLICASFFALLKISNYSAFSIIITLLYAALNSIIGIIDDIRKLKRRENEGLTPKEKLALQFLCSVLFLIARKLILKDTTELAFSFGSVDFGIFYYPLSIIILLGVVNCANLTDGIDGLASSVAFGIGISLFYISAALSTETSIISSALIGAAVGFLIFNIHPAKIFMGDTGSLFFGSLIAACAFTLKNPIMIIFIAGVYILEGISVILQVFFFKLTHKRIFKMAPFHHHLEQCGWSENKICIVAILATFIFSIPAYIFYLP